MESNSTNSKLLIMLVQQLCYVLNTACVGARSVMHIHLCWFLPFPKWLKTFTCQIFFQSHKICAIIDSPMGICTILLARWLLQHFLCLMTGATATLRWKKIPMRLGVSLPCPQDCGAVDVHLGNGISQLQRCQHRRGENNEESVMSLGINELMRMQNRVLNQSWDQR